MFDLLIVDDEKFVVDNLATTFPWDELGIGGVHTAFSAAEALRLIQYQKIDIVITDIRMPGMNGLELIEKIRETSAKTKCILLSGYADFQYARQAVSSQAEAYLVKPVKEEELIETVRNVIREIEEEWEAVVSQQRTLYTLSEHLPLLRGALLNELLQGKYIPLPTLEKKIEMLHLKIRREQPFAMMFVRMEQSFAQYDDYSRSLLEFGICNIAEEIFSTKFRLWQSKDIYDNLIFIITAKEDADDPFDPNHPQTRKVLERYSLQLQESVTTYLKGGVSVLISDWGVFPNDVYSFYQKSVSIIRSHPHDANGFFISSIKTDAAEEFEPLRTVQEPPILMHLLEAGRWEDAERKFAAIIEELSAKKRYVQEYIYEVAAMLNFSVSHTIHKQGQSIKKFADIRWLDTADHEALRSVEGLRKWGCDLIRTIKDATIKDAQGSQRTIIQKINQFVQRNMDKDVSLQTIADHVFLHPAYISKIYKMETGEGLSDYIYRLRMEKAAYLLRETNEKIHEISKKTGYQNPSHFSRVFKKYFEMTPDDFRENEL